MKLEQSLQILISKGYKATDKRKKILSYFNKEKKYISVKEIILFLKNDYPGLSYETAYKNLALFAELGILESTDLNGEKKFQLSCDSNHHHHLICINCGKSKAIEVCPMDGIPKLNPSEFDIVGHKFEVYGYCHGCR